jgi:hypothetical protein
MHWLRGFFLAAVDVSSEHPLHAAARSDRADRFGGVWE